MNCKFCGSVQVVKAGFTYAGRRRQRYLCKACGRFFLIELMRPFSGSVVVAGKNARV